MTEKRTKIVIPGDLKPGQDIVIGAGNTINGKKMENPTLPAGAQIVEEDATEVGDLAAQIRAKVKAKLAAKGVTGGQQGGIHIGGETKGGVVLQGDNMTVDTSKATSQESIAPKATRTLPFRAGSKITDANMNGVQFDGVWVLKTDAGGNPIKQGGQFVYEKQ